LLGADRDLGLLVLEDAGPGPSLADLLLGSDPDLAEQGLRAYAATLGRLHAQTAGRFASYLQLRAGLGPSNGQALPTAEQLPAEFETLASQMRGIGVEVSSAARDEVAAVSDALDEAGPFFAYSPSDICPDNNRYLGSGRLRLFDFEGGGFRHAFLDAAYLRLALPTCWCVNRLPAALPAALEAIYRRELARGCPAVDDDQLFERGLAAASAAWLIWSVSWQWQGDDSGLSQSGISSHTGVIFSDKWRVYCRTTTHTVKSHRLRSARTRQAPGGPGSCCTGITYTRRRQAALAPGWFDPRTRRPRLRRRKEGAATVRRPILVHTAQSDRSAVVERRDPFMPRGCSGGLRRSRRASCSTSTWAPRSQP
jgi:hypothetical protein